MKKQILFRQLPWLFLLMFGIQQFSYAQRSDMPVTKALQLLTQSLGTNFVFEDNLLDGATTNVDVRNAKSRKLEDILAEILYPNDFLFLYVNDNTYTIISNKKSKLKTVKIRSADNVSEQSGSLSQTFIIGRIVNENAEVLGGVSVKTENQTAVTNDKGVFIIKAALNSALTFSSIGFKTKLVIARSYNMPDIILSSDQIQLKEVEVSTGYQVIAKERAAGSFSTIADTVLEKKLTRSIIDRMEGMVSGLQITTNGPTSSGRISNKTQLSIRGRNTFSALMDPLVVIDGFPYESDLSLINPEDVAKITFLKDAAAASIWGVRAANGVIVIETKKGRAGNTQINFSTNYTLGEKPDLGYRPVASSADYIDFESEAIKKGQILNPNTPGMPEVTQGADILWRFKDKDDQISTEQRDALLAPLKNYDYKAQYSDYLLQKQQIQQYTLSLSGGSEAVRYFVSGSFSDELPNTKGDRINRFTLNSNNTFQLSKKLQGQVGFMAVMSKSTNNGIGLTPLQPGPSTFMPYDRIVDDNGNAIQYSRGYNSKMLESLQKLGYLPWKYDYLSELNNADNTARQNHYRINTTFKYTIISGLSADVQALYEKSFSPSRNYYNEDTYKVRNTINNATSVVTGSSPAKLVYGLPIGAILDLAQGETDHYDVRGQLNLNRQFGTDHRVDAIAGIEVRQMLTKSMSSRLYGYDDQSLASSPVNYDLNYITAVRGLKTKPEMPNTLSEIRDRYYSMYANANYTYKGRYVLSGSARIDDSNLFGASENYRATPLWSVGGMWRLGDESFMTLPFIDQLNIRMTYGVNGNVDKTTSPFLIARYDGFFYINGLPFARIINPSNPLLRWEKTKAFNVGIDLSLFKNRLNVNLDVYSKRSYDLLGNSEVNPTYGFDEITINTAKLNNHGVDLTLSGSIMRQKNFGWSSMFNFAYNTNRVTSSQNAPDYRYYVNSSTPITGKPLEAMFSYRAGMLDSVGRPTLLDDKGKRFLSEDEIDMNNVVYNGTTSAPYFGSLSNTFTYKQFELSAMLTYKIGHVFRRPTIQFFSYSTQKTLHKDIAARWRKAGDEQRTIVPVIPDNKTNYDENWYTNSDKMIESASHIRLREVSLAYQFPVKMIRKLHLKQLSLMVYGRNLAIWTKNKEGIDPDVVPGADYTLLPTPRSFAFGLRTSF